jgi:hypothetical protein
MQFIYYLKKPKLIFAFPFACYKALTKICMK